MRRRIKVEELSSHWELRVGRQPSKAMIRLKGKWLGEAGFLPNSHVIVIVEDHKLIIIQEKGK